MYGLLFNLAVRLGCLSQTLSDLACSPYTSGMGHEFDAGGAIFHKKRRSLLQEICKDTACFLPLLITACPLAFDTLGLSRSALDAGQPILETAYRASNLDALDQLDARRRRRATGRRSIRA